MKKIIRKAAVLLERAAYLYHAEPVATRMGLVAVLDVVVASGVHLTPNVSGAIQTVVLGALNLVFLVMTRQAVVPTVIADLDAVDAYFKGHQHAHQITKVVERFTEALHTPQEPK